MKTQTYPIVLAFALVLASAWLPGLSTSAAAKIHGIEGTNFSFTARADYLSTADGNSVLFWGFADNDGLGTPQYPGPTMIVNEGDLVVVELTNDLEMPVSMVFPGQGEVEALDGDEGILTRQAPADGATTVTYSFVAANPGTYQYHSGTRPEIQVEMGLIGALIVRPAGFDPLAPTAYAHADSAYDREYLFVLSEMDPFIHDIVEVLGPDGLAGTGLITRYLPNYWFINGRTAPDTMSMPGVPWLPTQPYNCMPMMHPGDEVLLRVVGAGRDLHPFHHHGNNADIIAVDGRLLGSAPDSGADFKRSVFTIQSVPGQTVDAIFQWTGERLGWDIYGTGEGYEHDCVDLNSDDFDDSTHEYCPDHGKEIPVKMTESLELAYGGFWSGSPFLGALKAIPPGEGGLVPNGGYTFMWHSHAEKEMANFDVFPGGMMTMMVIEAPWVEINEM
jgi:manganese oxidase